MRKLPILLSCVYLLLFGIPMTAEAQTKHLHFCVTAPSGPRVCRSWKWKVKFTPVNKSSPAVRGNWLWVYITGYDDIGTTYSGAPSGYGRIATDQAIFPMGTRFYIPGYGNAVAADIGGGVRGYHLDLWFQTPFQCDENTGMRRVFVYS